MRRTRREILRGVLDPDETSADILEDGTVLLSTFSRFAAIEGDVDEGDDALKRLGAHVTFVRPHTIEEVLAERKQRFREYLEGEESGSKPR
jgi:hypothetical protein